MNHSRDTILEVSRISCFVAIFVIMFWNASRAQTVSTFDVLVATETLTVVGTTTVNGSGFSVGATDFVVNGSNVGIGTTTANGQFNALSGAGQFFWSGSLLQIGGLDNSATGTYSNISGGSNNTTDASHTSVGGGFSNTASGQFSTVSGGEGNLASGPESTVAGGETNTASGQYSFAAGLDATASNLGSFVWADGSSVPLQSTANNQFMARAGGGFVLLGAATTNTVIVSSSSIMISTAATAASAVPNIYISSTTGNVGIGTSTPASTLDVQGSAQFGSSGKSTFTATGLLKLDSNGIQWADGSTSTTAASGIGNGGAWQAWTPSFTGFSSNPVMYMSSYTVVGQTVFGIFTPLTAGTSNATTFTITLPFPAKTSQFLVGMGVETDNGVSSTTQLCRMDTVGGSTTANIYKTILLGAWTASGAKYCAFTFTYEKQ